MIASRGLVLFRAASHLTKRNVLQTPQLMTSRLGHGWSYRVGATHRPRVNLIADVIGGFMWWWVMWHLFHEYQHITGEFDYPDPSAWTNEELGIPPDDFE